MRYISDSEEDLREETRKALLERIKTSAEKTSSYTALNQLAEAYAWVVAPNQSHGGVPASKS